MSYFEVYEDESSEGEYRWRVIADNGEIVIPPESYRDPTDAERGAKDAARAVLASIKQIGAEKETVDVDVRRT